MTNLNPLIIYHGDCNDGFGSALAAFLKFGNNAEYWPGMYDKEIPDVIGKDVFIFDYHFKEPILLKMKEQANSLILIDHHKSAQDILEHLPFTHFDNSKSGALLAWEHFFKEPVPEMFKWIQDRDLFENKYPESSYFYYYINSFPYDLNVWKSIYEQLQIPEEREKILTIGKSINNFHEAQMKLVMKHYSLPITIDGVNGWIINTNRLFASEAGAALAKINDSFAIIWSLTDKKTVACSVRSTSNYSARKLAEKYGGGGHEQASKFTVSHNFFFENFLNKI